MTIRVLIVDDYSVVRAGIRILLESDPDFEIVGEGETGRDAIRLTQTCHPDIILMDITMPEMDGIEATQTIHKQASPPSILALTIHEGKDYVLHMLEAGASGYVSKRAAPQDLLQAVRSVASGGIYLDPAVASNLAEDSGVHSQAESDISKWSGLPSARD